MANDDIIQRLDTIAAILRIAHADEIDVARAEITGDSVNKAILARTAEWQAAGALQKVVMKETKESQSTVKRRLASLVDRGVLERQGAGPSVQYRSTGLI